MIHLIEILSKNSNTVSYYFTNRDAKGFIDIFYITEPAKSNIKIQIYENINNNGVGVRQYNNVPHSIRLINEKIRYIDLAIIFDTKRIDAENPPTIDESIIKSIIDECAFNEDYCNYVLSIAEELNTIEAFRYVASNIVNTIIPNVIKCLENHSKFVTQAFEKYKANGYKLDC